MTDRDMSQALAGQVHSAIEEKRSLVIQGGASKAFYGYEKTNDLATLSTLEHRGIVEYDPSELVITARAGTPLNEINQVLANDNQILPFEPPAYGDATLGGTVAGNLSGPGRAYQGAARDYVLGVKAINGRAQLLQFGGQVMKNVAGYDVSRLLAGSWGSLGLMLDISLKVLPKPVMSCTLLHSDMGENPLKYLNELAMKDYPVTASCYDGLNVYVRLQGAESAVTAARKRLGGDEVQEGEKFWRKIREHEHSFFQSKNTLWRISVKSTAPDPTFSGKWLIEWGGGLRWYIGSATAEQIRKYAAAHGGHAIQFRNPNYDTAVFQPLSDPMKTLHKKIKQTFDPNDVFWSQGLMREV